MDFKNMTKEEQMDLLDKAKDAYYNSEEELLSDAEFDELERLVGLENNNYVGSDRGNYDVKHSFIMGSLAKTQVKMQKNDSINWDECAKTINNFLNKANGATYYETTPKLDGCSFSAEFKNRRGKAYLVSCATRGNGKWGSDIRHWFIPILKTSYWSKINDAVSEICEEGSDDILCIRGEVLVRQTDFSGKYVNSYVNPRAFAAGMLGLKFEDIDEDKKIQGNDLHFVCYDYRVFSNGEYEELSWMNPYDQTYHILQPYLNHIGELPDKDYCQVYKFNGDFNVDDLERIYDIYDDFRKNKSEYALDGVVFKPNVSARRYNDDRPRPVDCIAMKFMPMINSTEIIGFEWSVKKTGEYFPTALLKPFKMEDGKTISRASAHNYGWIVKNECGIGSIVRVSLAGDIIPFIYEIVQHENVDNNINMPNDYHIKEDPKSGALHLMKNFTEDEKERNDFIASANTLNINLIGPAAAEDLYDNLHDDIKDLSNIIYLMNNDAYELIYDNMGRSKSVMNYVTSLKQYAEHITLEDIIRSFNFKSCGHRASAVCAKIIAGKSYDTASLPGEAYRWALNQSSREYYMVTNAMEMLNIEIDDEEDDMNEDRIPIIMTGSPEACTSFPTKSKWLQAHPQYVETTKFSECKILFCDDLNSNSGKMQKAKKAGIEIRQYDDKTMNEKTTKDFDFNCELF
ncbi:MAG: NAD-dependent DNA ligase [Wendovervirus sonii]|uniref:DNA ligase (NAD(+)) n=1 Tax=phage Lak_Megaphage_Sonny TaxID=3109229 RepID=A0ABZ0Z3B5_9CAUD|nr:MAG: NAD-dependent DNA ligase [phage Lak_Megaphage_Sonny]